MSLKDYITVLPSNIQDELNAGSTCEECAEALSDYIIKLQADNKVLTAKLEGYKLLAEERRLFITNGAEFGIIEVDYFCEDEAATEVFERCKLTDEYAIESINHQ